MSPFSIRAEGGQVAADRAMIRRALSILIAPGDRHELRGLPSGKQRIINGNDLDEATEIAANLDGDQVYYSLNPLHADAKTCNKNNVAQRRWLLIDIDATRPKDTSATEEEKGKASEVSSEILCFLIKEHWSEPLMIDSGNGWHLIYRIDLPNNALSQQIIRTAIGALGDRFDTQAATVDRKVHDASRISKLPGTLARKGPNTLDRPHRLANIVFEPSELKLVTVEQLQALARKPASHDVNGMKLTASNGTGKTSYVQAAIRGECGRISLSIPGNRNDVLNKAAFALGTMADWPEMSEAEARAALLQCALQVGLTDREVLLTIASGWAAGKAEPRTRPIDSQQNGKYEDNIPAGKFIIWASTIKPRKVEWLDPGRIPRGKMTTFAGQTGLGKTFTICDLAARITTGREIPFGGGVCYPRGKVLIISAEDDADDTIVPRFMELGGDLSRLALLSPECEEKFSLSALELLNGCIGDMGSDVLMVAIDPPTSYLGKVDDHRNAELRGLLAPLRNWARDNRIALVFVTHVNKPSAFKIEAMARVMGSVAWVAAVRSAHMFCPDPMNPVRNLYLPLKVNNARKRKGLAYEIVSRPGDIATLKWLEEVDMTADDAMNQIIPKKTSGQEAVEWLIGKFREKPEWRSEDLADLARGECISDRAVFKSPEVKALPIDKKQRTDGNGERFWVWRARLGWPPKIKESEESAESDTQKP